jgi:hypothetical protein
MEIPLRVLLRVGIDAYTYLREVWNDELQPVHIRMRAAAVGIEFERPRLAVPSRVVLEFGDAISGISRVSGQAARSIG